MGWAGAVHGGDLNIVVARPRRGHRDVRRAAAIRGRARARRLTPRRGRRSSSGRPREPRSRSFDGRHRGRRGCLRIRPAALCHAAASWPAEPRQPTAAHHRPAQGGGPPGRRPRAPLVPARQGLIARNRKAPNSTRWTPPSWTVARPGSTVSARHDDGDREEHHLRRAEPEHERAVEPDRGDRDRRDREPDARHRRAEREVEARLHPVAAGVADGGDRLGEQHEQRDDDADRRRRRADRVDRVLDRRRLDLRQPDDGDERDDQQAEARQRLAVGRRRGVLVGTSAVGRPAGSSRGGARSARRRTAPYSASDATAANASCSGENSGPGRLVVNVGSTRLSVASVGDRRQRGRRPLRVELRDAPAQRADQQRQPDDAVAA